MSRDHWETRAAIGGILLTVGAGGDLGLATQVAHPWRGVSFFVFFALFAFMAAVGMYVVLALFLPLSLPPLREDDSKSPATEAPGTDSVEASVWRTSPGGMVEAPPHTTTGERRRFLGVSSTALVGKIDFGPPLNATVTRGDEPVRLRYRPRWFRRKRLGLTVREFVRHGVVVDEHVEGLQFPYSLYPATGPQTLAEELRARSVPGGVSGDRVS